MQVIWILYDPVHAHYDALVPGMDVDKVALLDIQQSILTAVKKEAKNSKVRARQLRSVNPPRPPQPPAQDEDLTEAEEDADMNSGAQLHQGIDGDGIVRDMTAYLEGAPTVVRRRVPLVFPNDQSGPNSNVRSFILMPAYVPRTCTCDPASTFLCHYFCTFHIFYASRTFHALNFFFRLLEILIACVLHPLRTVCTHICHCIQYCSFLAFVTSHVAGETVYHTVNNCKSQES
jgi:hypothetical protein